jgi:hypothetical protein
MRQERAISLPRWTGDVLLIAIAALLLLPAVAISQQPDSNRETLTVSGEIGRAGGRAVRRRVMKAPVRRSIPRRSTAA